jgi:hypothetical protein
MSSSTDRLAKSKFVTRPFRPLLGKAPAKPVPAAAAVAIAAPVPATAPARGDSKRAAPTPIARPTFAPKAAAPAPLARPVATKKPTSAPVARPRTAVPTSRPIVTNKSAAAAVAAPKIKAKLAQPAKLAAPAAIQRRAPVSLSAPKQQKQPLISRLPALSAKAAPILSDCGPCTLGDSVDFCVRITVPNGFDVPAGVAACAAVQSDDAKCDSQACTVAVPGITLPNPCDPTAFITCDGTVTLYKLHLGGAVDVLVNLPIMSTRPGDIVSCPGAIQLSRQICVPLDNVICIGCSPTDCSTVGMTLISSVTVQPPTLLLPGDTLGCEAIWQVQGTIFLNSSVCAPPTTEFTITTCFSCNINSDPFGSFTADLQLWDTIGPTLLQTISGVGEGMETTFAPVPPGTYTIHFTDGSGNEYVTPVSVTVTNANVHVPPAPIGACITFDCSPSIQTFFTCEQGSQSPNSILHFQLWDAANTTMLQSGPDTMSNVLTTFSGLSPSTGYTLRLVDSLGNQFMSAFPFTSQALPPFTVQDEPPGGTGFAISCPIQIAGLVLCPDATGPPASLNFTVNLYDNTHTLLAVGSIADPEGFYVLYPPGDGTYTVEVHDGFGVPISDSGPIVISGGVSVFQNFDIFCAVLTGQVTEDCIPTVDLTTYTAALYTTPFSGLPFATAPITAAGYWFFGDLSPGSYIFGVLDPSTTLVFQEPFTRTGVDQNLGTQAILCPEQTMTLQGCICNPPVGYVSTQLFDAKTSTIVDSSANTDLGGTCGSGFGYQYLNVAPGYYEVQLIDAGSNVLATSDLIAPTDFPTTTVDIGC